MISVKEYKPSQNLAPFVHSYYSGVFNTNAKSNQSLKVIPNGCLEFIIHLKELYCKLPVDKCLTSTPDYMLIGMFSRAYQVHFSETVPVFSIRFKPEALPYIFQIHGSEVYENYGNIDDLLENEFMDFCHRIREDDGDEKRIGRTERFLKTILIKNQVEENYVTKAARIIGNSQISNVQEISEIVNISQRQLERKFKEIIGISPKQYLRLIRMNKVMKMLEQKQALNLTDIAYYCGYFDQAHFIKDFKHITDQTPSSFINDRKIDQEIF